MVTTDYTISHENRMSEAFDNRYRGTMSRYHSILNMKRRYEEIIKANQSPVNDEFNPAIYYAIEELGLENISVSLSTPDEDGRIRILFYYHAAQFRTESDIHYINVFPEWIHFIQEIESEVFMDECMMTQHPDRAAKSRELRKALSRIVDALYDYFDNNCEHRN